MEELNKIIKKDPLQIADDDHPERKDITPEEFSDALDQIKKKYNQDRPASKEDIDFADQMAAATIAALNKPANNKRRS